MYNRDMLFIAKIIISALVIAAVSEIAKRFTFAAAILASLPLTSILAMIWLYVDTKDAAKVSILSENIFWAALPSLLFFLVLPILLNMGLKFYTAMIISAVVMFVGYTVYALILGKFGIHI